MKEGGMMEYFSHERIDEHVIMITDLGNVRMFLVEGSKKCCLVDTGFGIGNIKKYIEEKITSKPVFALITHCHIDHVNGCALFDECYLNEKDIVQYARAYDVHRRKYDEFKDHPILKNVPIECYDPERTKPFINVVDGDTFDLGGITLRVIEVPGHSAGSIAVLIEERRICIYGDAVGRRVGLASDASLCVSEYLKGLLNLKKYDGTYDRILRNHNDLECPLDMLDNVIECCRDILDYKDDKCPVLRGGKWVLAARNVNEKQQRIDGKQGNIFYREDKRK